MTSYGVSSGVASRTKIPTNIYESLPINKDVAQYVAQETSLKLPTNLFNRLTGGTDIQRESDAILRRLGRKLRTSEAVVTGPGTLPCRHIIHVAGPRWSRGKSHSKYSSQKTQEENLLYDATQNVLKGASTRGANSISLPAISSGIYGFPHRLCAETMLDAVLDFCQSERRTSVQEIRFTNNQQDITDVFLKEVQKRFGTGHFDTQGKT